ncbi:hypothetical protein [Fusobacterium canifelinum]|uniref:Uncharacterized protein n=1 Tax=Fusobacterium canifelinum TaxID=285729 RepID=A0ABX7CCR3_9FUSO|nr:hypothetical protein [Fusobacterium canifelinum]QQS87308.1 hypothetical protein I6I83_09725 [Fusobacterium canifelinum]
MKQTLLKIFEEKMDKERGSYISTWDKYAEELVEVYEKFIKHQPLEEQIIKLLSISYGDSFLNTGIYNAFKNNNMQLLHDTIYQAAGFKHLYNILPGVNHAYYSYSIMPELLCACRTDRIELILPIQNGLCCGKFPGAIIVDLFMALWYQDEKLAESAREIVHTSKKTKWRHLDHAYISYLCALLDKDVEKASEQLSLMCHGVRKAKGVEFSPFKKEFFILAHAMFNLSQFIYDGKLAGKVAMPNEDNFSKEFAQWQQNNGFKAGKNIYDFPEPINLYNLLLDIIPPKIHLIEKHKRMFIDSERFKQELIYKVIQSKRS